MEDIKLTLIQSDLIWEEIDRNLSNLDIKISSIKEDTDLVILPEMFSTAFTMNTEKFAEEVHGKTIEWMRKHASEKQCVIVGSLIVRENNSYFNRLIWMKKEGSYEKYDKRHLFRLGNENLYYTPGNEILITNLKGWKFRPLVCYDLRFPVWSKNKLIDKKNETTELRLTTYDYSYEYDCLIYIANWPSGRKNAWKSLLVARAIENQVYAIGVNRIGKDGNGVSHSGESIAVDYSGKIIYEFKSDVEEIKTIKLSYNDINTYRKYFAFGLDWDKFNIEF